MGCVAGAGAADRQVERRIQVGQAVIILILRFRDPLDDPPRVIKRMIDTFT